MSFEQMFYTLIIILWLIGVVLYIFYLRKELGIRIKEKREQRSAGRRRLGKRCPQCKNIIDYRRKVCQHCGYEFPYVPEPKEIEASSSWRKKKRGKKCPNCGNIINYHRTVCQHCGYKFPTNSDSQAES